MYNIVLGEFHPSTICVDRPRFEDSLSGLESLFDPEFASESLKDYIETYARTDEIMPEDKTIGFVVFNLQKKVLSISMSKISAEERVFLANITDRFKQAGFNCDLDFPN